MRDIVLTLFLVGGLPVSLARPFIGALIFAWISLMNPHRLTWGFAYSQPWALLYAIAVILGLIFARDKQILDSVRRYWPVLAYLGWMCITTVFADEPLDAQGRLNDILKVQLMCLVTLALTTTPDRVRWLIYVVIGSIAFWGVKGGLFTLTSGGGGKVWGPAESAIEDNNHLAAALVFIFPAVYWIYQTTRKPWHRPLLIGAQGLIIISVLGSHSRGAFLAVIAMGSLLVLRSRHKFATTVMALLMAFAATSVMPDKYWDRINSIRTYEEDGSTQGRINTWTTAVRIANERITGGGHLYYGGPLFLKHAPNPERADGAHSIYFQALGEHGWIGLAMLLMILANFWYRCSKVASWARRTSGSEEWGMLARMLQASLVGFAVNGAFIHIGNWDGFYFVFVVLTALVRITEQKMPATVSASGSVAVRPQRRAPPRMAPGRVW